LPRASRSSKAAPLSVGLDIVEIARIKKAGTPAFLRRVFSRSEIAYCKGKKSQWQHFAVRFAAKEAVYKALGLDGVALRDISVARDLDGRPRVGLRGKPLPHVALSLAPTAHYAAAVAVNTPAARRPGR
jgi:holo-[acyl-carrier protein] synthase